MKARLWILAIIILLCLCAPLLTRADPTRTNADMFLQAPSREHLLGTDHLGRDVWARLLWGGQRTLFLGVIATGLSLAIATVFIIFTTLLPRFLKNFVKQVLYSLVTLPPLIICLLVLTLVDRGAGWLVLAAAIVQVPSLVVMLMARADMIERKDYVLAAQSMGATPLHIMRTHIKRSLQPTFIALGVLNFSYALGMIATLSFLGLSNEPGVAEWGVMIAEARQSFFSAFWIPLAPGLALTIVISSVNSLAKVLENTSLGD